MFTEPQTSPTRRIPQIIYGVLVGTLYSSQLAFAGFYFTPEIALLTGNTFSYIVGQKNRLLITLRDKFQETDDICNFMFKKPQNFSFIPGQYLEWTIPHKGTDSRGNRRYFTIASSPTEDVIQLGIRFTNGGSSFKKALDNLDTKTPVAAGQLGGDFIMPADGSKKLVFIAGGIGITPFRSIIKYLIDKKEKRDIILFYANKIPREIVYKDIFDAAGKMFGLKTIYLTERLTPDRIKQEVPDYSSRTFYLSGPHAMVEGYKNILKQMNVPSTRIVTDYFPGYV